MPRPPSRRPAVPLPRTLYDHQVDALGVLDDWVASITASIGPTDESTATPADILIESATGSGKSLYGLLLMAAHVGPGRTFQRGIIATPQLVIADGFLADAERTFIVAGKPITIAADRFRLARSSRAIAAYLVARDPDPILVCTHQGFNKAMEHLRAEGRGDRGGSLLFLDEAHHARAEQLDGHLECWAANSGRIVYATATPFRSDDKVVARPGMRVIRRTLAEQMEGGRFAPATLRHEIVAVGQPGDTVTAAEFAGTTIRADAALQTEIIARMVADWIQLGCPKTIIRVPVLRGGSGGFVRKLVAALAAAQHPAGTPCRVFDATGLGTQKQAELVALLRAERSRPVAESEWDIIVGVQRVLEGMDWPHCSTIFTLGMPGMLALIQGLGRTTRLKPEDYRPVDQRDTATIRLFLPCAGGQLGAIGDMHAWHALLAVVYLADAETGEQLTLGRLVRAAAAGKPQAPAACELPVGTGLTPTDEAVARAAMAAHQEANPDGVTVAGLIAAAVAVCPDVAADGLDQIAVGMLAQDDAVGAAVQAAVAEGLAQLTWDRPTIRRDLADVFGAVVREFRDETIAPVKSLVRIGESVHSVNGEGIGRWVERFRAANDWDLDAIAVTTQAYRESTGSWPNQDTGIIPGIGRTWKSFDMHLRGQGSSLPDFLAERFPDYIRRPYGVWDLDAIAAAAQACRESTGSWPNNGTGIIPGIGKTWSAFDMHLRGQGSTLADFLAERFPDYIRRRKPARITQ